MNKKLMKDLGFENEVNKVELGLCPFCNKKINIKDFKDILSINEFKISGLCQSCQDKTFGGSK